MIKRIVKKEVIEVITQLGVPYRDNIKDVGLKKAAERALSGYNSGEWNGSFIKFIEDNLEDIQSIANGESVKFLVASVYRDAETNVLEIQEESK